MTDIGEHGWLHPGTEDFVSVDARRTHAYVLSHSPARFGLREDGRHGGMDESAAEAMRAGWVRINVMGYIRARGDIVCIDRFVSAATAVDAAAAVALLVERGVVKPRGSLLVGVAGHEPLRLHGIGISDFARGSPDAAPEDEDVPDMRP